MKGLRRNIIQVMAALCCLPALPCAKSQEAPSSNDPISIESNSVSSTNETDDDNAVTSVGTPEIAKLGLRSEVEGTDPLRVMWERAVEALDESYDQWSFRPEETVDSTTFTINYIASLATDGRRRLDRVMILHADPNQDRAVTRDEALGFLQSQIGLQWISGEPLRHDDGRVLVFADFLRADTDQDDEISKQEFVVAMWDREGGDAEFSQMDENGDRKIDLQEYSNSSGPNFRNVVDAFHRLDLDHDGSASLDELRGAVPLHRRHLVGTNFAAFDENDDQRLSMDEYRLSMLANYNYPWEDLPEDDDLDGQISFDEFQFHPRDLFQLQKRYYFHRLDRDQDGLVSGDEFVFRKQPMHSLVRVQSGFSSQAAKQIFADKKYPRLGSPAIRRGDAEVLFHAVPREGEHQAALLLVKSDGSEIREIGHGLMPSWSPNGDRFVCSRYDGGASVWIVGLDGNAKTRIDSGWGGEWSPNGKRIVYRNDNGIRLFDVKSGESDIWFDKHDHPYRYLHPHFAWSPDGQRLALFAQRQQTVELVVLQLPVGKTAGDVTDGTTGLGNSEAISGSMYEILFRASEDVLGDLLWTRDGRLLFSMFSRELGRPALYQASVDSKQKPKVVDEAIGIKGVVGLDVARDDPFWILNISN